MDHPKYTTVISERKKGQHLRAEDRGAIKILSKLGYSNRAIAQEIGCSPTTVGNELRLGTQRERAIKEGRLAILQNSVKRSIEGTTRLTA